MNREESSYITEKREHIILYQSFNRDIANLFKDISKIYIKTCINWIESGHIVIARKGYRNHKSFLKRNGKYYVRTVRQEDIACHKLEIEELIKNLVMLAVDNEHEIEFPIETELIKLW